FIPARPLEENTGISAPVTIEAAVSSRSGDTRAAIGFLERALQSTPKASALWLRLARAQRATGDYKQAAAAFRKCFALGERNLGREFAQAQAAAGDSNEALKLLREVVLEHEDAEAWTALACLLLDAKDRAAAS